MGTKISIIVSDDLEYGLDLASALNDAGMSVTLYLSRTNLALYFGQSPYASSNLLTTALYNKSLLPRSVPVHLFQLPRIRDPRSLSAACDLSRMIHEDHPDVVHIIMGPGELWIAILACLIRDLPVVSTMIIPQPNLGDRLPVSILWTIAKLLTLGSDLVIVNGIEQVDIVRKLYTVHARKVTYIPLIPRLAAAKWLDHQQDEEPGTVLFPGKAQLRKGLEFLVRAQPLITQYIPNARFVLAAHGEDLNRCRAFIRDESKFEIHDGFLTSAELAGYFQKSSLVTLPYLSASTSGMLTTAYVFGKPVVVTRVGALPEYVKEGETGLLVPPADSERLAEAIIRLLKDEELRHQMGKNARDWITLEQKRIAEQTIQVYETTRANFKKGAIHL